MIFRPIDRHQDGEIHGGVWGGSLLKGVDGGVERHQFRHPISQSQPPSPQQRYGKSDIIRPGLNGERSRVATHGPLGNSGNGLPHLGALDCVAGIGDYRLGLGTTKLVKPGDSDIATVIRPGKDHLQRPGMGGVGNSGGPGRRGTVPGLGRQNPHRRGGQILDLKHCHTLGEGEPQGRVGQPEEIQLALFQCITHDLLP